MIKLKSDNNIFYKSNNETVTYGQLLDKMSKTHVVSSDFTAYNYIDFAVNTILSILNDMDVNLVDYRNTNNELNENCHKIENYSFSTSSMLAKLQNSVSNIGIYSSGTEGTPKLIYQSVERLLKSVRIDDVYLNTVWGFTYNPSHSAGIQILLQALCNKATLVDLYKCSRTRTLEAIKINKINFLSGTPTFYRMLAPYDFILPNIQSITINGEKSTQSLINKLKKCFPNARIRNIYGSTEAGPLMSSETSAFQIPRRLIGKVKVVDNELLLHNSLVSKSVNKKEWYPTGDLVEIIGEDPLIISFSSRKSRILNIGGQNVNPQEVEEVLLKHSNVKDVRVFGRKNKVMGNLISAEVETLNEITEKELLDYCKQHLAFYKVPRIIKFVKRIEIGRTGKKSI